MQEVCVPVILSLEMPLHWRGDFCGKHLVKVTTHHFCHTSITGSQIQHPLPFPFRLDPEKTLKLVLREHKHGAAAQQAVDRTGQDRRPWGAAHQKQRWSLRESQGWLPVDGGSRHDGAEDGGEERVVELHEEPAGFLHASAKESLCVLIQVTLNELRAHLFSEHVRTAVVPL